ncbi:Zinc-finger double-stranded RNA-binding family protein [Cryptosporidium meleagridis]|uniref:Zinc-finger double-stranded RNA-binding family protein n=1 Tax=Cryptosporidium meleagridis TaxID=93969 RepID=A0A2P4Z2M9_9CRYT|nr:Zinc-finger double-stranded RNA-binding family protein [Cryptosporidium meleagridis]
MYKRVALFSSDLLSNSLNCKYLRGNIEKQINKVYGDDFSDESPNNDREHSESLLKSEDIKTESIDSVDYDFIGKFKCILCPKKIIINESDLDKHIKSKHHLNMVEKWQKKQEYARKIREKFNILNNLTDGDTVTDDINSKSALSSDLTPNKQSNRKNKKRKNSNLSEEQIIAKKMKFMRKKERRLARKSQIAENTC